MKDFRKVLLGSFRHPPWWLVFQILFYIIRTSSWSCTDGVIQSHLRSPNGVERNVFSKSFLNVKPCCFHPSVASSQSKLKTIPWDFARCDVVIGRSHMLPLISWHWSSIILQCSALEIQKQTDEWRFNSGGIFKQCGSEDVWRVWKVMVARL